MGTSDFLPLSVETDYTFPLSEKIKAFLADLFVFVAVALGAAITTAAPPAKAEVKEELEKSHEDVGFDLFD